MTSPSCDPLIESLRGSTVVQLHNIDYALHTVIPERNGTFDPDVELADPSMVDVWLLDVPTEFSRKIRGSMRAADDANVLAVGVEPLERAPLQVERVHGDAQRSS